MVYSLLRRLLQSTGIVFLYYYPILQVTAPLLIIFMIVTLLIIFRPHHRNGMNFFEILNETNLLIVHLMIVLLAYDNTRDFLTYPETELIGWIVIGCCCFVMLINFCMLLGEAYTAIRWVFRRIRKFKQSVQYKNKITKLAHGRRNALKFNEGLRSKKKTPHTLDFKKIITNNSKIQTSKETKKNLRISKISKSKVNSDKKVLSPTTRKNK
jgi:hypothetical protein